MYGEQTLSELISDAQALDRACQDLVIEAQRELVRVPAKRVTRPAEVSTKRLPSSTPYRDLP